MSLIARRVSLNAVRSVRTQAFRRNLASIKYTTDHEYVKTEGDVATVGVTQFAADALGDIVYVELPEVGSTLDQKESMGVVESVKAASDVYMPLTGEIVEVNNELTENPALINGSPLENGWMAKIKLSKPAELDEMMDEAAYKEFCDNA
eukprot:CAMPEP_0119413924 /NCGR_PEP_ID=MMETSP1335-20130426/6230_1 /TAXON_ID=259385 /ORGANISM="Chrysoculter rhomboideus, Strain RCC1486" /LENGTH=148 /DNA_ID=CAMNT_0007438757 /DNA_START=28 /DNA_END=474 /DNA_ORIENTATION=+